MLRIYDHAPSQLQLGHEYNKEYALYLIANTFRGIFVPIGKRGILTVMLAHWARFGWWKT